MAEGWRSHPLELGAAEWWVVYNLPMHMGVAGEPATLGLATPSHMPCRFLKGPPALCRALGDDWPGQTTELSRQRRLRRREAEPPLLSLSLGGVFSLPLVPRPLAPRLSAAGSDAAASSIDASSITSISGGPPAVVLQLPSLVELRQPGVAARLAATGEVADASFFARWLKARGGSLEAAADSSLAHAAWREEFVGAAAPRGGSGRAASGSAGGGGGPQLVGAGISEESIADELAARKVFLQGCDSLGCPVVLVRAAR